MVLARAERMSRFATSWEWYALEGDAIPRAFTRRRPVVGALYASAPRGAPGP